MTLQNWVALIPTFVKHSYWQLPEETLWNSQQPGEKIQTQTLKAGRPSGEVPEFSYLLQSSQHGNCVFSTHLDSHELPMEAAKRLFNQLLETLDLDPELCRSALGPVTVEEDPLSRQCLFVYTIAVPQLVSLSQTVLDTRNFCTERLVEKESVEALRLDLIHAKGRKSATALSPHLNLLAQIHTIKHWADLIASTTAATELLPKYFSMNQLKDVYTSLFFVKLDATNFKRWVRKSNPTMIDWVANDAEIKSEVITAIMDDLAESKAGNSLFEQLKPDAIQDTLNSNILVGASPMLKGTPESRDLIKYLPPIVTNAIVKSSSTIAFQHLKQGVTTKYWYQAESHIRRYLKDKFGSKPAWIDEGAPAD